MTKLIPKTKLDKTVHTDNDRMKAKKTLTTLSTLIDVQITPTSCTVYAEVRKASIKEIEV